MHDPWWLALKKNGLNALELPHEYTLCGRSDGLGLLHAIVILLCCSRQYPVARGLSMSPRPIAWRRRLCHLRSASLFLLFLDFVFLSVHWTTTPKRWADEHFHLCDAIQIIKFSFGTRSNFSASPQFNKSASLRVCFTVIFSAKPSLVWVRRRCLF